MSVHTIYFGGGTPTLLSVEQFERILSAIHQSFTVLPGAEISSEANPDDLLESGYARELHKLGIQRLSIGAQSAIQSELEMFGRLHDAESIGQAVGLARQAGFEDLNIDLIYGNPHQTLAMWAYSLDHIIQLNPDHLSLYALGLEPKTAMDYWVRNKKLPAPDDDLTADMYEFATDKLSKAGFDQYEISNWARPGHKSRHNMQYWHNLPYLGLGPGAHGYAGGIRYEVVRSPHQYIEAMQNTRADKSEFPLTPAVSDYHVVDREDEIAETIMMGMRLLDEGISLTTFEERFGQDLLDLRGGAIKQYQDMGYLSVSDERIRFTAQGRLVSNRILRDLI